MNQWKINQLANREKEIFLDDEEAQALIQQFNGIRDTEFEGCFKDFSEIYKLDDGRYILSSEFNFHEVEESREKLIQRCKTIEEYNKQKSTPNYVLKKYKHILEDYNINEDYLNRIDDFKSFLSLRLKIDTQILDETLLSLKKLDERIDEISEHQTLYETYPAIVAYCGRVIINEINGKWHLVKSDMVMEPYVINENGRIFNPFSCSWHVLFNVENDSGLYSCIRMEIVVKTSFRNP